MCHARGEAFGINSLASHGDVSGGLRIIFKAGGPGSESKRLAAASTAAFERATQAETPLETFAAVAEAVDKAGDAKLAAAYTYLQRAVGVLAVLLVVGHGLADGQWLRESISSYYYTHMGNVFVGVLAALAVFFLSYNYRPLRDFELDSILSKCASLVAAGVAVFPTASAAVNESTGARWVSRLHLVCAGALFVLLGVFARFRFTKTGSGPITPEKRRRNRVYRAPPNPIRRYTVLCSSEGDFALGLRHMETR